MDIAVVSFVSCFPTEWGSRRRILNLTRALRRLGHNVSFIYLSNSQMASGLVQAHQSEFGPGHFHMLEQNLPGRAQLFLRRIASKVSQVYRKVIGSSKAFGPRIDDTVTLDFIPQIKSLQAREHFEVVFGEYLQTSPALSAFGAQVFKVLDTHDSLVNRHLLSGANGDTLHCNMEDQLRGFLRANAIVAIQPQELDEFRDALAGSEVSCHLVSHFLESEGPLECYKPIGATFLGSQHSMNQEAMAYFMRDIVPAVLDRIPQFRLQLIGGICETIPDHPILDKLKNIEDLRIGFQRGPISIVPTLSGTGISIKLLDSMALGVPIVTTRTGARGLGPAYRNGMVMVEDGDPRAFSQALIALLESEGKRAEQGRLAYSDACCWHETQMVALEELLRDWVNRRESEHSRNLAP